MIGILSDAHGHYPAFAKAITILRAQGAERFVFLGDAVGYIPSTRVLGILSDMGDTIKCVRGNHEEMLIAGNRDPEKDKIYQLGQVANAMASDDMDFIRLWPLQLEESFEAGEVLFIHGSPDDPLYGYVYPDTDCSVFDCGQFDYVFMGHTHRPFIKDVKDTRFVNVGSCGLPRDHGGLGSAALFDEKNGSTRIIRFDISAQTQQIIAEAPPLHPSVIELFNRKNDHYFGDYVEG